jgi:VWFA-related protein
VATLPFNSPRANRWKGSIVDPTHPIVRTILAGLLIAASEAYGIGQASPVLATSVPASNPSSASPTDSIVLRSNANLVLVDVVVTDRGNSVHGLDRGSFLIFEDGHEQTITTFDQHTPVTASAAAPSAATMRVALPLHTYTNVPPYPLAPSVNVLLLDGLNTPMSNQINVRRQMIQFLDKIEPGTSLAIFALSSRLRLVEGFTTDAAQLTKALQNPGTGPQTSLVLDPQTDQAVDSVIGDMANMTGGAGSLSVGSSTALSSLQQFEADMTAVQTDRRVQMTLEALQQMARYLSGISGRKNLIWFSGSFPIALDPDDSLDSPFEAMRNYSQDIRETAELLSAARVAVYPVDARGLMTPPSLDASYSPTTNLMGATVSGGRTGSRRRATVNKPSPSTDDLNATKRSMAEQASMQQIAEQTGGQEYMNTNGLKEAVASAVENGSTYYTIGYVPAAKQLDGQFRKIQVRLNSRDFKLAYRHGYYADPPDKPSEHTPGQTSLIVAATLHGAPPSTQILFQARALSATDPILHGTRIPAGPAGELTSALKAPLQRFLVDLRIDPHGIQFDTTPDGAYHSKVEFVLVAFDTAGRRVNYLDSGFQMNMKADEYSRTLAAGIPIRLPLDLPVGQFFLRIAVHDLNAGRAGSLEFPVTVAPK